MLCPLAAQDKPEPLKTSITVVGEIAAEAPANISVMNAPELAESPGVNLDERLRQVPGFSLFRRSSSLIAHPTTQGVSLRGMGSSGASRSLVLWDGIPINDPFGGWVYWTQLPTEEIGRVEISRGASTSIFGDRAMAGAIALFSRPPERRRVTASYQGGNYNSHDLFAGASNTWPRWALSGWGRAFTTDGFYIIPEPVRGPVDRPAGVRFAALGGNADFLNTLFFKVNLLAEDRQNGTALQTNSTGLGTASLHFQHGFTHDSLSLAAFHTREEFHSSFSSVSANRRTETPTFRQTVPAEAVGADGVWRHAGSGWNLLGGGDLYRTEGYSTDTVYPVGRRVGGGVQWQHGLFAQADKRLSILQLYLGLRHSFTGGGSRFWSPSAGVVAGRHWIRARGSVYRAFRAPTLNELFREFRVGNSITQANPDLRPETLFGAEAGVDLVGESAGARVTLYRNSLENLITNVTVSSTPNLLVQQRRNAASALSRGVEAEAHADWRKWRLEAGYLFADTRFATGERIPQVPRHQGTGQLVYRRAGTLASVGVRSYGYQFQDDRNQLLLPGYATLQFVARQRLTGSLSAVAEFENLLDRTYLTLLTPVTTGTPRLWRAGLRWSGLLP